jgi:c-di-AMP phosphodiesterase-like protein
MKKTAVEWLIGRFHYEGFIGTYCSEEQIKSKRQIMIEIIEQAKEMEKQQIIEAHGNKQKTKSNPDSIVTYGYTFTGEAYYNETYKNTKQ